MEEEESVGTQGESLADGVGVIEVAESSNESGSEANQEERPTMLKQATREVVGEHVGGEETPARPLDANVTMRGSRMSQGAAMLTEGGRQVA
jgi:hypothetical protein